MSGAKSGDPWKGASGLPLRVRGAMVVAIPVVALLVAMGVFFQFEQQTRRAAAYVQHTYDLRSEVRRTLIRMVNAETGLRGYLLTGRTGYLEPYWAARRELPDPLR